MYPLNDTRIRNSKFTFEAVSNNCKADFSHSSDCFVQIEMIVTFELILNDHKLIIPKILTLFWKKTNLHKICVSRN